MSPPQDGEKRETGAEQSSMPGRAEPHRGAGGTGTGTRCPATQGHSKATPEPRVNSGKFQSRSVNSGSRKTQGTWCPGTPTLPARPEHSGSPSDPRALPRPRVPWFVEEGGRGSRPVPAPRPVAADRPLAGQLGSAGPEGRGCAETGQVKVRRMNPQPRSLDSVQPRSVSPCHPPSANKGEKLPRAVHDSGTGTALRQGRGEGLGGQRLHPARGLALWGSHACINH